jgi:hypothetical protein
MIREKNDTREEEKWESGERESGMDAVVVLAKP